MAAKGGYRLHLCYKSSIFGLRDVSRFQGALGLRPQKGIRPQLGLGALLWANRKPGVGSRGLVETLAALDAVSKRV